MFYKAIFCRVVEEYNYSQCNTVDGNHPGALQTYHSCQEPHWQASAPWEHQRHLSPNPTKQRTRAEAASNSPKINKTQSRAISGKVAAPSLLSIAHLSSVL